MPPAPIQIASDLHAGSRSFVAETPAGTGTNGRRDLGVGGWRPAGTRYIPIAGHRRSDDDRLRKSIEVVRPREIDGAE
jgi:hypothetical protein